MLPLLNAGSPCGAIERVLVFEFVESNSILQSECNAWRFSIVVTIVLEPPWIRQSGAIGMRTGLSMRFVFF